MTPFCLTAAAQTAGVFALAIAGLALAARLEVVAAARRELQDRARHWR